MKFSHIDKVDKYVFIRLICVILFLVFFIGKYPILLGITVGIFGAGWSRSLRKTEKEKKMGIKKGKVINFHR